MDKQERTFDCTNCGASVIVEFGTYVGGPLAYDDYAKCKNCGREYTDQAEIDNLVAAKRALTKKHAQR
jgi:transcription elongation factor Elf1